MTTTEAILAAASRWLPVLGWEGVYEVSDSGVVRGVDRKVRHRGSFRMQRGVVLRPSVNHARGVPQVNLRRGGGRGVTRSVHVLVAEAFLGPRPDGMVVRHLDDQPRNNTVGNLAYGSPAENSADAIRNNRLPRGERIWASKLTAEDVRLVRRLAADGTPNATIARRVGIGKSSVGDIVLGRAWTHIR